MVYNVQDMNNPVDKEDSLTLEILEVIENQSHVTQRHLADRLGVALGLANSYLKRCIRKGLIKVQQAPANRYLYYITPKGFAEKSRLTARYLSASFDFYRQAGDSLSDIYRNCQGKAWNRILFCGISELAEIAAVRAVEHNIQVVGIFDPYAQQDRFLRLPVVRSLDDAQSHDACMLTAVHNAGDLYNLLAREVTPGLILVPSILGLNVKNNHP
jgi:DNA-binding MarR family transcriptional regulator